MPESSSSTDRVRVGWIGRAHGIEGEVTLIPDTDYPLRFEPGARFRVETDPPRDVELVATRRHQGRLLARFSGVEDRTEVEALRGAALTIGREERRALEDDEYWPESLVGLEVRDRGGERVGSVASVDVGDAQDRLVIVTVDGNRATIPFVRALVPEVRVAEGYVVVEMVDGLLSSSPD